MNEYRLEDVFTELRQTHKLHIQLMGKYCHEMTPDQVKLLFMINKKEMSQKELAHALHVTEATLSVRIKRLLDANYIERKVDENDKRMNTIVLSRKGKHELENMNEYMKRYYELLSKGITQEEFDTVVRVIQKIQNNLKEEM